MWFHTVLLLSFFVGKQCMEVDINCFTKEKNMGVLDLANDTLEKLKHLLPNCTNDYISSNDTECGVKEKALALLEITTDLISEAKRNYPNCLNDNVTDPVTNPVTDPVTNPVTDPVTNPVTDPVTNPVTEPVTINDTDITMDDPIDCDDVYQQGIKTSGIYRIWPKHDLLNGSSILVYCEMDVIDGKGWTVIQRRGVNYTRQDFNQDWDTYEKGFGDLIGEFWLGNKNIYALTNRTDYMLHIDLEDVQGIKKYASYYTFWLYDLDHYRLFIEKYSGTAGNSMKRESYSYFITKDRPQNVKVDGVLCVESRATGWWYSTYMYCNGANLNGLPGTGVPNDPRNLYWKEWKQYESLARATMKIRRR